MAIDAPRHRFAGEPRQVEEAETLSTRWSQEQTFASVLELARRLDQEALGLLYRQYLTSVFWYAMGRLGDVEQAEDVTSETFLAMVDSIARVRAEDDSAFEAWLLGIARNKVSDHFRRQAVRPTTRTIADSWDEPFAAAEAGDPLGVVVAREQWADVIVALQQLTEEQRTVLLYRCVLGYDTEEVARLMERQPGAIRALQFRALASLSRLVAANGTNPRIGVLRAVSKSPTSRRSPQEGKQRRVDEPRR